MSKSLGTPGEFWTNGRRRSQNAKAATSGKGPWTSGDKGNGWNGASDNV